jgi:hypothetical protein
MMAKQQYADSREGIVAHRGGRVFIGHCGGDDGWGVYNRRCAGPGGLLARDGGGAGLWSNNACGSGWCSPTRGMKSTSRDKENNYETQE